MTPRNFQNKKLGGKRAEEGFVWGYIAAAVFLGLGAPAGSLIFRTFYSYRSEWIPWLFDEWRQNQWFYIYMTVGTVCAFVAFASVLAVYYSKLRARTKSLAGKARELEERSEKDPMTGLYNFGIIRERINIEMERARRFQTPLSCLMMDVDALKSVNDHHGHPAGDALLNEIAGVLQKEVRMIDTATRYGGDEFLLILPVTGPGAALTVAERIRKKIEESEVSYKDARFKTTLSIGVASYPAEGIKDAETLVDGADQALYEAKSKGRNTVQIFRPGKREENL